VTSWDLGWLTGVMLLTLRVGAIATMAAPLGAVALPALIRLCVVLALAVFLSTLHDFERTAHPRDLGTLLPAMASELALGAVLALGLNLGFAMFALGARLVDVQIGFGLGQVLDPLTKHPQPVLAAAFGQLSLVTFFALDGHHALLRGLVLSVEHFPPGTPWLSDAAFTGVTRHVSQLFSLGFAMVAPVVTCLILVEFGLGILARNLPQINTLTLGMPVKVVAGLAALAVWISDSSSVVARAHASIFAMWESLWK
jgi:flagellar biosynthetic protein FliR